MIKNFFREDLKDFKPYDAEKNEYRIRMDANESYLHFPDELKEKLLEAVKDFALNRYPDPTASDVCRAYADYAKVDFNSLMAGNGSDELIQITSNAFINDGDKVMILSPDFSMYNIYIKLAGGIPIVFDLDEDFKLNAEELIDNVNREEVKLLFISNPNNPTGGVISRETIIKIIEGCNCIVVIDEAYYEFYGKTVIDLIDKYENLIVLRTCSKAMGLAALRVGFLASNKILLNELRKAKPPYNLNAVTQTIAEVVLRETEIINSNIKAILEEREFLLQGLKEIENIKIYPTNSNFVTIKVNDAEKVNKKFLEEGIKVRSFKAGRLKNCLRITVGSRAENEEFLKVLRRV
ncbi:histidinol-phosphate transaminase [Clostridium sp. SYSU_GA19001]|uniref:histidinol-phosphate transaminase n=1 Tax=Clostridium caldaquaticum TaxID=2940653 RepID=UPI00207799F0|nr:histidinol-phosphate transaminase [Clostridium caldaquaticum]MCM8711447.1 histidinol-phosphate transaminase [Clostridium caldaquaticum]